AQSFFTGKDYKALAEKMLTRHVDFKAEVNKRLGPVNKELAKREPKAGPAAKVGVQYKNGFILHVKEPTTPKVAEKVKPCPGRRGCAPARAASVDSHCA